MPHTQEIHPIRKLKSSTQHLDEQTTFAARQVKNGIQTVRQANASLADLDLEKAFSQLREMVAMVGGKPQQRPQAPTSQSSIARDSNVIDFAEVTKTVTAQAAE